MQHVDGVFEEAVAVGVVHADGCGADAEMITDFFEDAFDGFL